MKRITLKDDFLSPRQKNNISITIPSCLKRCEETGRIEAFRLQWREGSKLPCPDIFWDSDVAKVLEGMAYIANESPEIASRLDELVDLVVSAQLPDGYLNTHYSVAEKDKRWSNLGVCHELYCAGHLIEAAVAHFECTGKRLFIDAICRYADYICSVFGENGCQGYPGHEEIELALCRLYRATGDRKYLQQAKFFIDRRGNDPCYFVEKENYDKGRLSFCQAHKPVREQTEAVGHAVRGLYLYSGMADVASETGDIQLLKTCEQLFDDLVCNKIYITGGVGSHQIGESIGGAGEQIAERSYAESCAAIAMVFFCSRMLGITGKRKYADALERTLYNCALSGLSLDGDRFFYANLHACHRGIKPDGTVSLKRQAWYDCSCCPTNYCRFLPQLGNFCYRATDDFLAVDIPAAGLVETSGYMVELVSDYPYGGNFEIHVSRVGHFTLVVRIPEWCHDFSLPDCGEIRDGYWTLEKTFSAGEKFSFSFLMETRKVFTSIPSLTMQAAIQRGPLIYCVEEPLDKQFSPFELAITRNTEFEIVPVSGLQKGTKGIQFHALHFSRLQKLYSESSPRFSEKVPVTAIPYALWQNRDFSEMTIFMPYIPEVVMNNNSNQQEGE